MFVILEHVIEVESGRVFEVDMSLVHLLVWGRVTTIYDDVDSWLVGFNINIIVLVWLTIAVLKVTEQL